MNKKIKGLLVIVIFILMLIISKDIYASEGTTQKLYQDITINKDGSITIKEMALLSGKYEGGRSREIDFENYWATPFTGIYSNFTGNSDIYNGTSIKNIKIYDISQKNFNTINDINKVEKVYKEVDSAKKGKYGVYTLYEGMHGIELKIYCPDNKKKVFCMEYTITDAVVIHNDVAELYWNVMGENYSEEIEDFQVIIHLPGEDDDLRVWTHGPLTGVNKIVDNKTVFFKDTNVDSYEPETIRIMFDKDLVPYGTKKSNVNGREYILQYEQTMADSANAERYNAKLELINDASKAVINLEKYPEIYYYNYALKKVSKIEDGIEKQEFIQRIDEMKDMVNEDWKESVEKDIKYMIKNNYKYVSDYRIKSLEEDIEEGFDENAKEEYRKIIQVFYNLIEQKEARTRKICLIIVIVSNLILSVPVIYKLLKIFSERHKYKGKYYREFPSEDNPYLLEYLMKRKVTNVGFSATILSLITKKVIKLEKDKDKEGNLELILLEKNYVGTKSEKAVLKILFNLVGNNGDKCSLEKLKKYGASETNARRLIDKMNDFKNGAKVESENKNYFKTKILTIILQIIIGINYLFSMCMATGIFQGVASVKSVMSYLGIVTIISGIYFISVSKDKNRTTIGKIEYSKWLAHKRFLKDFSNFDEKELPEIALWEKYLVTATVLGCADKVRAKMKLYINNYDTSSDYLLLNTNLGNDFIKTINKSVNSSINTANRTYSIATSSSSSSSGGGFGGGSSGGGGGRRPEVGGGGRF